jgi:hypothetical protein
MEDLKKRTKNQGALYIFKRVKILFVKEDFVEPV